MRIFPMMPTDHQSFTCPYRSSQCSKHGCSSHSLVTIAKLLAQYRILVILSHLLGEQQSSRELGPDYAEEQAPAASKRQALRWLEQSGSQVTFQPAEVA